jgi:hypothetical protein
MVEEIEIVQEIKNRNEVGNLFVVLMPFTLAKLLLASLTLALTEDDSTSVLFVIF